MGVPLCSYHARRSASAGAVARAAALSSSTGGLKRKKRDRRLWLGNGLSYVQPSASGSGLSSRESYFSSFAENVYKI